MLRTDLAIKIQLFSSQSFRGPPRSVTSTKFRTGPIKISSIVLNSFFFRRYRLNISVSFLQLYPFNRKALNSKVRICFQFLCINKFLSKKKCPTFFLNVGCFFKIPLPYLPHTNSRIFLRPAIDTNFDIQIKRLMMFIQYVENVGKKVQL